MSIAPLATPAPYPLAAAQVRTQLKRTLRRYRDFGYEDSQELLFQRDDERLAKTALALGVEATIIVRGAPFVICGAADGRSFCLHERHNQYTITIAPNATPEADPWSSAGHLQPLEIAAGPTEDLASPGNYLDVSVALRLAVSAVRRYLKS